jgi:hypothetical protein
MMNGNNVYIFESMFDGRDGYFKGISTFMEGMWVVALAPAMMIIIGTTFQPLARILLRSESYLACLEATLSRENLSLQ